LAFSDVLSRHVPVLFLRFLPARLPIWLIVAACCAFLTAGWLAARV